MVVDEVVTGDTDAFAEGKTVLLIGSAGHPAYPSTRIVDCILWTVLAPPSDEVVSASADAPSVDQSLVDSAYRFALPI